MIADAPRDRRSPRGFTLTELMVAIAVLLAVLLATGKIFSTVSKVTGAGEANTDVLQESAAVAEQLRRDIEALSREGVFAIRCVAVPNDLNGAQLLNPNLPPNAYIRADQLLFFTTGNQGVRTFIAGGRADQRGEGASSRIYYGHAFQLTDVSQPVDAAGAIDNCLRAYDVDPTEAVFPWSNPETSGSVRMVRTAYDGGVCLTNIFDTRPDPDGPVRVPAVDARKWLVVRHAAALMDDDDAAPDSYEKADYLRDIRTAKSIFLNDPIIGLSPQLRDGRVDAAATLINDMRVRLTFNAAGTVRPWRAGSFGGGDDQFTVIGDQLLYYPRAERRAPSVNRVDQSLTNNVMLSACSSFKVDWTWDEGVGEVRDAVTGAFARNPDDNFDPLHGVLFNMNPTGLPARSNARQQPWFGMPDVDSYVGGRLEPDLERMVGMYGDFTNHARLLGQPYYTPAGSGPLDDTSANSVRPTIFPANVERIGVDGGIVVYEAFFGFNRDTVVNDAGAPDETLGYTPWPSAIRVTMTLHDTRSRLESGREVEVVVRLPER